MSETLSSDSIGLLRQKLAGMKSSPDHMAIVEPKDQVFARYQHVFSTDRVGQISKDEFRSFLMIENNKHWTGLHRQGPRICQNMKKLHKALTTLVDEKRQIEERLDEAISMVSGMGKNIATAILLIVCPDHYGVWNNRTEAVMKRLSIWPKFDRGEDRGDVRPISTSGR